MIYWYFCPFSLLRILIFSTQDPVNWTEESPEWWPSDITFANPTGGHGFTPEQCDKIIHAFIEANVAYMDPDSPDLIDDTFEEDAVRFESDTVSVLVFVMVIHLWLTMPCHKNLGMICVPLFRDVLL